METGKLCISGKHWKFTPFGPKSSASSLKTQFELGFIAFDQKNLFILSF
jgi:hypothetical protein